jgi:hypothetical protein
MPYWKLQLSETLKAGAFETWVPKLELGNQHEKHLLKYFTTKTRRARSFIFLLHALRAFVVIVLNITE